MATKTADFTSTCNHTDDISYGKKLLSADISLSSLVICLTYFFFLQTSPTFCLSSQSKEQSKEQISNPPPTLHPHPASASQQAAVQKV